MKRSIIFRVDGDFGKRYGSGHVLRSIKIYENLKKIFKNDYNFAFLTRKNLGSNFIKKITNDRIIYYSNLKSLKISENDIVIIDTLGADKLFLNYLYRKKIKKIISFDQMKNNHFKYGTIINGIFFTKKKFYSSKNVKIFQGLKFIVLDNNFSKKKFLIKNTNKKIISICSGGNDQKSFSYKIANTLKEFKNTKIHILLGKGVSKSNPVFKLKNLKNIKIHINKKNIFNPLRSSHISFVTGGTTMFEAICCGTEVFVGKSFENQKFAIKYFKSKNLINYMGKVSNINLKNLKKEVENFMINKKLFKKKIQLIDGKGLARVTKIIKNIIKS